MKEETIDLSKAELHLVTNRFVPDSLLVVQLSQSKDEESIASCLANLRNCGLGVPESVKRYAGEVLSYSDQEIGNLIRKFRFYDGRDATSGSNLKENIISYLHIPEGLPSDQIVHSLLGWIHDTALDYWRAGEPAWITRKAFDNQLFNIIQNLQSRRFTETAKHLLPVSGDDRDKHRTRMFVRQLMLLDLDGSDDLIDCIDDYIRCTSERTRLSREGWITRQDIISFDNRLQERWKIIFKREKGQAVRSRMPSDPQQVGYDILMETLNHREKLAGQDTEEFYLTRGSYHKLADNLKVGWHPEYEILLKNK